MTTTSIIVSDLHLADGHVVLDGFGDRQQSAFEGLLQATIETGPLGQADNVELVINGDCFDLLVTPPYTIYSTTDLSTALGKLDKIILAHHSFFQALRHFINTPGRHVTFTTGNHDIELRFGAICTRIREAIGGEDVSAKVHFSPTRFYRPLPDVYIEHGNYYDFWNHATEGLWNELGEPLPLTATTIQLPVGSRYFQTAAYPISTQYPYFDHFMPSMNSIRQIALLCLLNPEIVIETAQHTMEMLSEPRKPLADLESGDEKIPVKLFSQAMLDFAAFQQDMEARKTDWVRPVGIDQPQAQSDTMVEYMTLYQALELPLLEAVRAICIPATYQMEIDVAAGMQHVLEQHPEVRYAIAGHTHMLRKDVLPNARQTYLNTASWTVHLSPPAPEEVTPELVEWLRQPDWQAIPLQDITEFTFALVNSTGNGPSSASLCVWEGGRTGSYRTLV